MLNCTLPNSAKYSAQQVLLNPFSFIYLQLYKWTTAFSRLSVEFSEPTTVKNLWSPQVKMHSVKNYVGPELRKHKLFQKRMHQPISLTLIYLFVSLFVCLFWDSVSLCILGSPGACSVDLGCCWTLRFACLWQMQC